MDDIDQTIPPQQHRETASDLDATMPGRRDRRPDGRFEIGDLILGRYKVLSELGQGGMGVVYKCFDETAGIVIAMKALPPELSHNTQEMEDVRENFQLVSKLVHQNIAISKNLERDQATGNYYLIMECVEGEGLRHWIRRKRRDNTLTVESILPVIRQVATALDFAHEQKIIHRDIKPGNIRIAAAGHVKVLDFGLAAQIHTSMTRVSMAYHGTSGTAPYMAPEQWRGRAQGAAADQYALAVMTYEMLAGHLPFESSDATVLREAVLHETVEPLEGIPVYAQQALTRALSKDPRERFNTCSEFAAALGGKNIPAATPDDEKISDAISASGSTSKSGPPVICPACKKENAPDADFCVFCGGKIGRSDKSKRESKRDEEALSSSVFVGDPETLKKRISVLIEQQDWNKARKYCERLLDSEPENPELYLLLCMISLQIPNEATLRKCVHDLSGDKNYQVAIRFASPERKKELEQIQQDCLVNIHLKNCMDANHVSDISLLSRCVGLLGRDENFQKALNNATEERRKDILQIQYDQADFLLNGLKQKIGVSSFEQVNVPLGSHEQFQTILKYASPERQAELKDIQQKQYEFFFAKCMEAYHVSKESELTTCMMPLAEDQSFETALSCATPERKKELRNLQQEQAAFFLSECLKTNHISSEADLHNCPKPLTSDPLFGWALQYGSKETQDRLKTIQAAQSNCFLQKCMEKHHVSDASELAFGSTVLKEDSYFRRARECATREQADKLDLIASQQAAGMRRKAAKRMMRIAVVVIVLTVLGAIFLINMEDIVAFLGSSEAKYKLARRYEGKNEERAMNWYHRAAKQGHVEAQFYLGNCYDRGTRVRQDYAEAVKWYRKAAEQGHAVAQFCLGCCYLNGIGIDTDPAESVKWFRKAADQGDRYSQFNLGWCYESGNGVTQDYAEAANWYRKAADQGDVRAQSSLGSLYEFGNGVPQDYSEAVKLYRKDS